MNQDESDRQIERLNAANTALLTTVGTLLGIIVGATSIIAAVGGSKSNLLFATIVVSFVGVACVLSAFYEEKKGLLREFQSMAKMKEVKGFPPPNLVGNVLNAVENRVRVVNRISNTALAVTVIAAVLFLFLCAKTFCF